MAANPGEEAGRTLRAKLRGDVLTDAGSLQDYATDASPYQSIPMAVARPRGRDDCHVLVEFARTQGIPLIPRAAGTSLAGQCVGGGIVVDTGFYQNAIRVVRPEEKLAIVEPGVVRDALNNSLQAHGLVFAPDPSTTARCQISGMVGNNSWGLHALRDGTTRDHVLAMEAVLSDGSHVKMGAESEEQLAAKCVAATLEAHVHKTAREILAGNESEIRERYPTFRGVQSNTGYALDALLRSDMTGGFNLAQLLCGSEGTLALITEVTVRLRELPKGRSLLVAEFDSMRQALLAVPVLLATAPDALEVLGEAILQVAARDAEQRHNRFWDGKPPQAVLLIEYSGETDRAALARARQTAQLLKTQFASSLQSQLVGAALERAWTLRRSALSLLMEKNPGAHAVTGIEDAAVPVDTLADFYDEIAALLAARGLKHYVHGPAGMGAVHIRPVLPLQTTQEIDLYASLMEDVAAIVAGYGGSFSCKHGDGRMRGRFLTLFFGERLVAAHHQIKRAFDPHGIFNPGKVLDNPPLTSDLRPD